MTIDEAIRQFGYIRQNPTGDMESELLPEAKELFDVAIDTMRKYQKIEELYDYWRSGKCEYTISCMENIGKVLKDGKID